MYGGIVPAPLEDARVKESFIGEEAFGWSTHRRAKLRHPRGLDMNVVRSILEVRHVIRRDRGRSGYVGRS